MPGENKTKKSGPVRPGAAKKAHQTRVKRKVAKAVRNSDAVTENYIKELEKGKQPDYTFARVTRIDGGGRFLAYDFLEKSVLKVKVAKALSTKKAKHRNAVIPIAVHLDSFVLLDGANQIKAVVGERDAGQIRRLLHIEENQDDELFNRDDEEVEVNLNDL